MHPFLNLYAARLGELRLDLGRLDALLGIAYERLVPPNEDGKDAHHPDEACDAPWATRDADNETLAILASS